MRRYAPPMCLRSAILILGAVVAGCNEPAAPSPRILPQGNARLTIDDVTLFVPIIWNARRRQDARPWPNGLQIDSGGWGSFTPWLGPIEGAEPSQVYRTASAGQHTRPDHPGPFFFLKVTFEFPAPPLRTTGWGGREQETVFPFRIDRLTLSYRSALEDVERPYSKLLRGIRPDDGKNVGNGWRELHRSFGQREIALRFDANDWRAHGGPLPRRIAASFSPSFWSHFTTLNRTRWTAAFETQNLPVDQWRARYVTTDELFAWLQTPPEARDPKRRFQWWSDLRFRPTK